MYDQEMYGSEEGDSPWEGVRFSTDLNGRSTGTLLVSFGYSSIDLVGKTLIIADANGIAGGCGVIGGDVQGTNSSTMLVSYALSGLEKSEIPLTAPEIKRIPGYLGLLQVTGSVSIETFELSKHAAVLGLYPGYTGQQSQIQGYGEIIVKSSTNLQVNYVLENLKPSSSGGIHVHTGSTCSAANGHYYDTDREDPWIVKKWTSDINGRAKGTFFVRPGPNSINVLGRTLVVHDSANSARAACGVIQTLDFVTVQYDLKGVQLNRFGKVAVHEGNTCKSTELVGLPYKDSDKFGTSTDPWGMKYGSGPSGTAVGSFNVAYGFSLDQTIGRVVVVYDSSNVAVACGVLTQVSWGSSEVACLLYGGGKQWCGVWWWWWWCVSKVCVRSLCFLSMPRWC